MPDIFALTFLLPAGMAGFIPPGRIVPCLAGCLISVLPGQVCMITAPTRNALYQQLRSFLMSYLRHRPPIVVACNLLPAGGPPETWTVVVNGDVVVSRDPYAMVAFNSHGSVHDLGQVHENRKPDLDGKARPSQQ